MKISHEGIYAYLDIEKDNEIVYIGKDTNIDKNTRHKQHLNPRLYDKQVINRRLQDYPSRYEYCVLKTWEKDKYHPNLGNALEILYIKRYDPRFNYTLGGEGTKGLKHKEESKRKISKSQTGNKNARKYSLWDPSKCTYNIGAMLACNKDAGNLRRCFKPNYKGRQIPIGYFLDPLTCEIISDLVDEAIENDQGETK